MKDENNIKKIRCGRWCFSEFLLLCVGGKSRTSPFHHGREGKLVKTAKICKA